MTKTIQERFEQFHQANPQVLNRLEMLAAEWFNRGNTKVAIGMLWEVLRWESDLETTGESGYRLNDHFRSRYARLMVERRPNWADRFSIRELRAA